MDDVPGTFRQPLRQRLIGAAGAGVMMGLIGAGLLWGLAASRGVTVEHALALIDVHLAPPPPPRPKVEPRSPSPAAKKAPVPRNLRNQATDVVAKPAVVPLPAPTPVVVAPKANVGTATQTGASDRVGAGEGAGGRGDGTGGGGEGDGSGYTPPRQIRGRLKNSDLPGEIVHDQDADGLIGSVGVRYHVATDGRVDVCTVTSPSGKPVLDALTCRLIQERFRFRPSLDPDGRPVGSEVVETHSWGVVHEDEPAPRR